MSCRRGVVSSGIPAALARQRALGGFSQDLLNIGDTLVPFTFYLHITPMNAEHSSEKDVWAMVKRQIIRLGAESHACNPSTLGG